uniref:Transposase n=1 Tax=Steinernema glaseri TaxID=37863 RepID=A0A1I7YXP9_9BILA
MRSCGGLQINKGNAVCNAPLTANRHQSYAPFLQQAHIGIIRHGFQQYRPVNIQAFQKGLGIFQWRYKHQSQAAPHGRFRRNARHFHHEA